MIQTLQYHKTTKLGKGHSNRYNAPYRSIIVHTTNGNIGTSFENEAKFLQTSPNVGAHFLVAKDGRIAEIVPLAYQAYHTGLVKDSKYSNQSAIGIEVHFTPLELSWTVFMWEGLTRLVKALPDLEIVTHREIAIPKGRKVDPSGVTDTMFNMWRKNIHQEWHKIETKNGATLRNSAKVNMFTRIKILPKGRYYYGFKVIGETVQGNNTWYATPEGYFHESGVTHYV